MGTFFGLTLSVDQFEGSLSTFSENTRDLKEFNYHLKDNVQRMSLSFSDFTQSLQPEVPTQPIHRSET
jgi:hypothetical protein